MSLVFASIRWLFEGDVVVCRFSMNAKLLVTLALTLFITRIAGAQTTADPGTRPVVFGPYEYEVKPDDEAFRVYNLQGAATQEADTARWRSIGDLWRLDYRTKDVFAHH